MKNLKNTLAAIGLAAVLGVGTVSANTGLIITDKSNSNSCSDSTISQQIASFFDNLTGIILGDRDGIILGDKGGCQSKDGIILGDRNGLIITD
jgi:hypothetical protein